MSLAAGAESLEARMALGLIELRGEAAGVQLLDIAAKSGASNPLWVDQCVLVSSWCSWQVA